MRNDLLNSNFSEEIELKNKNNRKINMAEEELFSIMYGTKTMTTDTMIEIASAERSSGTMRNRITNFSEDSYTSWRNQITENGVRVYTLSDESVEVFNKRYGVDFSLKKKENYSERMFQHQDELGLAAHYISGYKKIDMYLNDAVNYIDATSEKTKKSFRLDADMTLISVNDDGEIDFYILELERTQSSKVKYISKFQSFHYLSEGMFNFNIVYMPLIKSFVQSKIDKKEMNKDVLEKLVLRDFKILFVFHNEKGSSENMLNNYKKELAKEENSHLMNLRLLFNTFEGIKEKKPWSSMFAQNLLITAGNAEILGKTPKI